MYLQHLNDQEHRRFVRIPGYTTTQTESVTRCLSPSGQGNVYWQDPNVEIKCMVRDELEWHKSRGAQRLTWKVYGHDAPTGLETELLAQGFEDEGVSHRVAGRHTATLPGQQPLPPGYEIRRLQQADDLNMLINLYDQIWPGEDNALWLAGYAQPLSEADDGLHLFAVFDPQGQAVASGGMIHYTQQHCGHLFGGGSHPSYRRRGFHRALIAKRAQVLHARGGQWLIVDAGDQSWPGLARLGFEEISRVRFYSRWLRSEVN